MILMEPYLNYSSAESNDEKTSFESQRSYNESVPSKLMPQQVVSKILDKIPKAQEEGSLHFTLSKEIGLHVVQLLDENPVVENSNW